MHEKDFSFTNPSGERLEGTMHLPPKPSNTAVIFLHGFGSYKDQEWIRNLCQAFCLEGLSSVRFDFSGCGKSQGSIATLSNSKLIADVTACLDHLEAMGFNSFGLVGHSLGAVAALLVAAKDQRVKAVVNIAATAYPTQDDHIDFMIQYTKTYRDLPDIPKELLKKAFDADVLNAVSQIKAPLLVIHGDEDKVIPLQEGRDIFDAANEPKKMVIAMGSGHYTFNDPEFAREVTELSVDWMKKYLK